MEEIDKIYLTRTLKLLRSAEVELKRVNRDEIEVNRLRHELERVLQRCALLIVKSLS